jgi:hypothetical protein
MSWCAFDLVRNTPCNIFRLCFDARDSDEPRRMSEVVSHGKRPLFEKGRKA